MPLHLDELSAANMAVLPLGLAPKTIKYLLFGFNLLFVVSIHGVYRGLCVSAVTR